MSQRNRGLPSKAMAAHDFYSGMVRVCANIQCIAEQDFVNREESCLDEMAIKDPNQLTGSRLQNIIRDFQTNTLGYQEHDEKEEIITRTMPSSAEVAATASTSPTTVASVPTPQASAKTKPNRMGSVLLFRQKRKQPRRHSGPGVLAALGGSMGVVSAMPPVDGDHVHHLADPASCSTPAHEHHAAAVSAAPQDPHPHITVSTRTRGYLLVRQNSGGNKSLGWLSTPLITATTSQAQELAMIEQKEYDPKQEEREQEEFQKLLRHLRNGDDGEEESTQLLSQDSSSGTMEEEENQERDLIHGFGDNDYDEEDDEDDYDDFDEDSSGLIVSFPEQEVSDEGMWVHME